MENIKRYTDHTRMVLEAKERIDKSTSIFWAVRSSNVKAFDLLLEEVDDIDMKEGQTGWTLLTVASMFARTEMMKSILRKGASLNERDREGWTALHWAAWENNTDAISILLGEGAEVDPLDNKGQTPLILSFRFYSRGEMTDADMRRHPYYNSKEVLLDAGANPNALDKEGETPLKKVVKYLVDQSKLLLHPAELQEIESTRPMRTAIAKLLIEHGADIFKAFDDVLQLIEFFKGDVDWIKDPSVTMAIRRIRRSNDLFGED